MSAVMPPNDYENMHTIPSLFDFDSLHSFSDNHHIVKASIITFISEIFPTNLDKFNPDFRLFIEMKNFSATLIGSYPKL